MLSSPRHRSSSPSSPPRVRRLLHRAVMHLVDDAGRLLKAVHAAEETESDQVLRAVFTVDDQSGEPLLRRIAPVSLHELDARYAVTLAHLLDTVTRAQFVAWASIEPEDADSAITRGVDAEAVIERAVHTCAVIDANQSQPVWEGPMHDPSERRRSRSGSAFEHDRVADSSGHGRREADDAGRGRWVRAAESDSDPVSAPRGSASRGRVLGAQMRSAFEMPSGGDSGLDLPGKSAGAAAGASPFAMGGEGRPVLLSPLTDHQQQQLDDILSVCMLCSRATAKIMTSVLEAHSRLDRLYDLTEPMASGPSNAEATAQVLQRLEQLEGRVGLVHEHVEAMEDRQATIYREVETRSALRREIGEQAAGGPVLLADRAAQTEAFDIIRPNQRVPTVAPRRQSPSRNTTPPLERRGAPLGGPSERSGGSPIAAPATSPPPSAGVGREPTPRSSPPLGTNASSKSSTPRAASPPSRARPLAQPSASVPPPLSKSPAKLPGKKLPLTLPSKAPAVPPPARGAGDDAPTRESTAPPSPAHPPASDQPRRPDGYPSPPSRAAAAPLAPSDSGVRAAAAEAAGAPSTPQDRYASTADAAWRQNQQEQRSPAPASIPTTAASPSASTAPRGRSWGSPPALGGTSRIAALDEAPHMPQQSHVPVGQVAEGGRAEYQAAPGASPRADGRGVLVYATPERASAAPEQPSTAWPGNQHQHQYQQQQQQYDALSPRYAGSASGSASGSAYRDPYAHHGVVSPHQHLQHDNGRAHGYAFAGSQSTGYQSQYQPHASQVDAPRQPDTRWSQTGRQHGVTPDGYGHHDHGRGGYHTQPAYGAPTTSEGDFSAAGAPRPSDLLRAAGRHQQR